MPSAAVNFRAVCGCFLPVYTTFMLKRAIRKHAMRIAIVKLRRRVDGVTFGLLLSYLFWGSLLLQCGDIESNPGPNPPQSKDKMRQTRLASAGAGGTRASMENPGNPQGGASSQPVKEPTLTDVMSMLQALGNRMDSKLDEVKEEVHTLREEYTAMQDEVRGLREEVSGLRQQNDDMLKSHAALTEQMEDLARKTDDLEGRSRRNNLIFHGLERRDNETSADCEDTLRDLFTDRLELSQDVEFDRIHRLNSKPDSPVIARCVFYKQKLAVLKAKSKLRGTNIFIGEDFSSRVREVRRKLTPHLKRARSEGKRAVMIFNHLLIDGTKYTMGTDDRLIAMK